MQLASNERETMCLQSITKRITPTQDERIAWKYFREGNETYFQGTLLTTEWTKADEREVLTEQWEVDGPRDTTKQEYYKAGFHCFVSREDAVQADVCLVSGKSYADLKPVVVKEVTTIGVDGSCNCADYIELAPKCLVANYCRLLTESELAEMDAVQS